MCSGGCHCCQSCSLADPVIIPSQGARQRIIHHPGRRDWRAIRFGLVPPSLLCYTVGRKNAVSKKENTHTHAQHFRACHLRFSERRSRVWHVYKHTRPLQIPSKLNTHWWCEGEKNTLRWRLPRALCFPLFALPAGWHSSGGWEQGKVQASHGETKQQNNCYPRTAFCDAMLCHNFLQRTRSNPGGYDMKIYKKIKSGVCLVSFYQTQQFLNIFTFENV